MRLSRSHSGRAGALALTALLGACPSSAPEIARVELRDGARVLVVRAEVADDPAEQQRGLMGRTSLAADAGMLFLFDGVADHGFWMKDTLIPLDLLVLRDGRVVKILTMQPCREEDDARCTRYPTGPADGALEIPAGTAARAGIGPGARVTIEP